MVSKAIKQKYIQIFGVPPQIVVEAPGRINIIGEHTDYNQGFVLPAAINKYIYFAVGKNDKEDSSVIYSVNFSQKITIPNLANVPNDSPSWLKYIVTILQLLEETSNKKIRGINVCFGGDIPVGAGMSSSAAVCCGFLTALSTLLSLPMSKKEIALMAQKTEHSIGIQCGLMDQYACLFGRKEMVMLLDCKNLTYRHFPLSMKTHEILLVNSMVQHELAAESGYNERRKTCEDTVALLRTKGEKVSSLRDCTIELLKKYKDTLSIDTYQRCKYVIEENERVISFVNLLKENKIEEAGEIMFAAHRGMKEDYQITIEAIDFLIEQAKEIPAMIGGRMMGGGFGGCTINIVEKNKVRQSEEEIITRYEAQYKITPEVYSLQISDGVKIL